MIVIRFRVPTSLLRRDSFNGSEKTKNNKKKRSAGGRREGPHALSFFSLQGPPAYLAPPNFPVRKKKNAFAEERLVSAAILSVTTQVDQWAEKCNS